VTIAVAFTVDHSARNEEQRGVFGHGYCRSLGGCVGEKSEGEACRGQLRDSRAVAEQCGRVSGVGVTQGPELFVITGNEGRAGVDAAAHINQPTIDSEAEFGHGIRFVDVRRRKQLQSDPAEDLLCSDQEVAIVPAPSGDIKQTDQNAFGTGANGVVEISSDALADEDGSDVGPGDLREDGWDRFHYGGGRVC
jgi:hypothetical protein